MHLLPALPRERTPWGARALALALAAAGPLVLALGVGTAPVQVGPAEPGVSERVVALVPPLSTPVPDESPRVDGILPPRPAASVPPTAPAVSRAGARISGMPGLPLPADSSGTASAAPAARPDAERPGTPPSAREVFRSPLEDRAMCLPPCGGSGATVAGGDGTGTRAGAGVVFPPLTKARRDSIAQAVVAAAAREGGATSDARGTMPPNSVGVSLQVGLPGGGPTAAQRARDRALHADVSARLARIRARADSLADQRRRDSVARASGIPARSDSARARG